MKTFASVLLLAALVGCGSSNPPAESATTNSATPSTTSAPAQDPASPASPASGAKEGETCGDGVMGRPNRQCAEGLKCVNPPSTAPTGPAGSSSALPGKCEKLASH